MTPVNVVGFLVELVVLGVILGIFVWLAGKALGAPKATYYHGILTVISAIILKDIISYFLSGWVASIVELLVVLLLIKHFFGVGWLRAFVIAILAVVIGILVIFVLALLGFTFFRGLIPGI